MDGMMFNALADELDKISAAMSSSSSSSSSASAMPAPPRTTFKDVTKAQTTKAQGYSNINMQAPMAAIDTASGSKTVPPPPVKV